MDRSGAVSSAPIWFVAFKEGVLYSTLIGALLRASCEQIACVFQQDENHQS